MDRKLAAELARMAKKDQRMRLALSEPTEDGVLRQFPAPGQLMAMTRIDVANSDRLREILAAHGWPGRSLVGKKGADNAWLLAQHADHQLDLQRHALALLTESVAAGEAEPSHLAYLTDRVRMNEGRKQLYGTQMADVTEAGGVAYPVERPASLDRRRAAVGLEPFADYARQFARGASGQDGSG